MGTIVDWLSELKQSEIDSILLIQRIVDFKNWCENQPEGKDAGDDIRTIYVVALFEKLFRHEATHLLIPHLASKEDLVHNADYLKSWVGEKNYDLVLAQY
jgi:hypothetical protein